MEAGPLLSAVYEASHPTRYPMGEHVHFRDVPFDLGLIHYASDTPYTQARTLGSRSLSFEGIDSTYAATVAVLRRILTLEAQAPGSAPGPRGGQARELRLLAGASTVTKSSTICRATSSRCCTGGDFMK